MCSGFYLYIRTLPWALCALRSHAYISVKPLTAVLQYINVCMHVCVYGNINACTHACMYACIYVHSYVMCVCMNVCVYICIYVTVCMYICIKFLYANPICFHNCCLRMILVQCQLLNLSKGTSMCHKMDQVSVYILKHA